MQRRNAATPPPPATTQSRARASLPWRPWRPWWPWRRHRRGQLLPESLHAFQGFGLGGLGFGPGRLYPKQRNTRLRRASGLSSPGARAEVGIRVQRHCPTQWFRRDSAAYCGTHRGNTKHADQKSQGQRLHPMQEQETPRIYFRPLMSNPKPDGLEVAATESFHPPFAPT